MNKILYLIASHTNPEQVVRLVKTIKIGSLDSQILIHHDYSSSYLNIADFEGLSNVRVIENYVPVTWGDFSQVEMELNCINWLMTHSIEFDWLVFLSGQDYPIKPLAEIEQFLEKTRYDGFMEYFSAKEPPKEPTEYGLRWNKNTGVGRFFFHYYKLPSPKIIKSLIFRIGRIINGRQPLITMIADRNGARLGVRCFSTPFTSEFQCYAGSQWYTLSYRCIQYIHDFVQHHPGFVKHYQNTIIPDESFFQTILINNIKLKILNNNKRYIPWTNTSPIVLGIQDFDSLITSDKHFARKFDVNVDAQVLKRLDRYLSTNQEQLCSGSWSQEAKT
ncbi:MAG: beta-1,6-N-acetylglucosaminyltransferase [Kastovskya adunca ATA6-11-RM4]|jgi:hypothetical protein|nr:beta-1,6-N-acetylglucosaminyltransferase [Kastovskya adunca ATA6-11-RM4]